MQVVDKWCSTDKQITPQFYTDRLWHCLQCGSPNEEPIGLAPKKKHRFILPLPKQYYLGDGIGQALFLWNNSQGVMGIMYSVMGFINFYTLNIHGMIPFWIYVLSMVIVVLIFMIGIFIMVTPSQISFANKQAGKHNNPVIEKQLEHDVKLDLIMNKLGITEDEVKKGVEKWKVNQSN